MSTKNFIDLSVVRLNDNRLGTVVHVYNENAACVEIEKTSELVDITLSDIKETIYEP